MKKMLFVCILGILFLTGCSNDNSKFAKKYEKFLNSNGIINNKIQNVSDPLKIDFDPFKCKADNDFIVCDSNSLVLYKLKDGKKNEFLKIGSINIRTNDFYTGNKTGEISLKDYYDNVFSRNKKAQTIYHVNNIKLSDNAKALFEEMLNKQHLSKDKLEYIKNLFYGNFNLDIVNSNYQDGNWISYDGDIKLYDNKNNSISVNVDALKFDDKFYSIMEQNGCSFNADTYSMNTLDKNQQKQLQQQLKNSIRLNGIRLAIRLDKSDANMDKDIKDTKKYLLEQTKYIFKDQNMGRSDYMDIDNNVSLLVDNIIGDKSYKVSLNLQFRRDTAIYDLMMNINNPQLLKMLIEKIVINDVDITNIIHK